MYILGVNKNCGFSYLNLLYIEVKKGQLISDLDGTLWSCTTHTCAKTTIQLNDNQLVEKSFHICSSRGWQIIVLFNLLKYLRLNIWLLTNLNKHITFQFVVHIVLTLTVLEDIAVNAQVGS